MPHFSIEVVTQDRCLRFHLAGELDIAGTEKVADAVAQPREWSALDVVAIDLRELEFVDSSGLRALFMIDATAREHGAHAVFVRGPAAVQRIFEVTALDVQLDMVDGLDDLPHDLVSH